MKRNFKVLARTLITFFPSLKDHAYTLKRSLRLLLDSAVEEDFNALRFFPDRQDLLFLDIGTNQGAALDVFLKRNRSCTIYAFEPNPNVFQKIHARFKTHPRVKLHNFGLGVKEGTFKFFVPVYRGYEFDGWGSLSPDFDDSWLGEKILFYNRKFLKMREIECVVKRLDDLGLTPFFIKIDVQGSELDVVQGGETTIKKSQPIILLESGKRDGEIKSFLAQFRYRLYSYSRGKFIEGQRGSPNSFFMTDDKYKLITQPH